MSLLDVERYARAARLARWLGPWTEGTLVPDRTVRREVWIEGQDEPFRAWVFRRDDQAPSGALLLVPGLHFAGPSDPRLERFARVLARAGFLVLTPFLPAYTKLVVAPSVVTDTSRSLDALLAQPDFPARVLPGLFSISFGSMPTLRVAAQRSSELAGAVIFGGFADFRRTLRFALEGDEGRANDPLNAPVVLINLLPWLDASDAERTLLARLLRQQCERTWGKEANKTADVYVPSALALAEELPAHLRDVFLRGCRALPGTAQQATRALERSADALDWIDPRPHFATIRCPVHLVHGRDDDVIPHEESAALEAALAPHTRVTRRLTGLYGHTQGAGLGEILREARMAARELSSLVGILGAISGVSELSRAGT